MDDVEFDYNQIPPGYYDLVTKKGNGVQRFWHLYKFDFVIKQLKKDHEKKGSPFHIVDLGCGPGTFLGLLSKASPIVGVGVDIANTQIEYANLTYGSDTLRFKCTSLEDQSLVEDIQTADAVSLIEVIEHMHLPKIREILSNLHQHMKVGSKLVITTPNYLSYWPILEHIINYVSEVNYEEQHVSKFNRIRLASFLAGCGFQNVEVRSFLHCSPFVSGLLHQSVGSVMGLMEKKWITHGGPLLWAQATR